MTRRRGTPFLKPHLLKTARLLSESSLSFARREIHRRGEIHQVAVGDRYLRRGHFPAKSRAAK